MDLPDLQKYKDKFSQQSFIEKIQRIAKRAGAKLVYVALILYYLIQSDKVSLKDKAVIIGALGYLISPLDVVPDAIPIAGLGDDLTVLLYALGKVWTSVDEEMKGKARENCRSGLTMMKSTSQRIFLRIIRQTRRSDIERRSVCGSTLSWSLCSFPLSVMSSIGYGRPFVRQVTLVMGVQAVPCTTS